MNDSIEYTDKSNSDYADEQGKRLVKLRDIHGMERFYIDGQVGTFWNGGPVMTEEDVPQAGYVCVSEDRKNNVWYPNNTIVQLVDEPVPDTVAQAMIRKVAEMKRDGTMPAENATPVQLPVPDAIVDTVVSNLSVGGDLLQEQIEKIRERNVPEVSGQLEKEITDKFIKAATSMTGSADMSKLEGLRDMGNVQSTDEWKFSIPLVDISELGKELLEKVPADEAIQHDMREFDVYNTLEQILADIWKIQTREITIQELAMKVQRSINNGAYIQQNGTI